MIGKRGHVRLRSELILRFDYGSAVPWVTRLADGTRCAVAGPDRVTLRTPIALHGEDLKTVGEFTVAGGETIPFVLSYSRSHEGVPEAVDPTIALDETEHYWRKWIEQCSDAGEYSSVVRRSLLTLKALTYRPTGGIVAAVTTSLPEKIGGSRNWDYRYCWLRDATFTLRAMMNEGYYQEAQAWRGWLIRAAGGDPSQVQIMYGVAGERRLTESEVSGLPGYEHSQPVRIGNAAFEQRQLDVYGEIMEALHQGRCGKLAANESGWALQRKLVDYVASIWDRPDHGLWEMRGAPQQFTYSKVMTWVAMDRAIRSAEQFGLEGPVEQWRQLRRQIHEDVCRYAFNTELGAFTQSYGSKVLDASVLLLPLVGFLPADDSRMRGTIEAIERHLIIDGLVRRYDTAVASEGSTEGEGVFLACSFWLADNLLLLGRRDDAVRLFERVLSFANDVGLLSEEFDTGRRRLVGNFPQALSHIALINTARNLTRSR